MIQKTIIRNPISKVNKKITGNLGETLAVQFLTNKGFRLVKKNYQIRGGELDLIMENDVILLFVEVKTRTGQNFGEPEDALSQRQTRKLIRAILYYLGENKPEKPWRCDLIGIRFLSPVRAQIKHIKNILGK